MIATHSQERKLLAAVARGDAAALGELYDSFGPPLYGHLQATKSSNVAADRVLLEAFRALWVIAPRLSPGASVERTLRDLAALHESTPGREAMAARE